MISGFASPDGAAGRVFRNVASGKIRLVTSPAIENEYIEKAFGRSVARLFQRRGAGIQNYPNSLAEVRRLAELVCPEGEPPPCRDESDRKYLHCALAGQVDYLVTQDSDLLVLEQIAGIPIVRPATFLALAEEAGWLLDP